MQVDKEIREQLAFYCLVTKQTQEEAANQALRELLDRCDGDPVMKARLDKAKALKEELAAL